LTCINMPALSAWLKGEKYEPQPILQAGALLACSRALDAAEELCVALVDAGAAVDASSLDGVSGKTNVTAPVVVQHTTAVSLLADVQLLRGEYDLRLCEAKQPLIAGAHGTPRTERNVEALIEDFVRPSVEDWHPDYAGLYQLAESSADRALSKLGALLIMLQDQRQPELHRQQATRALLLQARALFFSAAKNAPSSPQETTVGKDAGMASDAVESARSRPASERAQSGSSEKRGMEEDVAEADEVHKPKALRLYLQGLEILQEAASAAPTWLLQDELAVAAEQGLLAADVVGNPGGTGYCLAVLQALRAELPLAMAYLRQLPHRVQRERSAYYMRLALASNRLPRPMTSQRPWVVSNIEQCSPALARAGASSRWLSQLPTGTPLGGAALLVLSEAGGRMWAALRGTGSEWQVTSQLVPQAMLQSAQAALAALSQGTGTSVDVGRYALEETATNVYRSRLAARGEQLRLLEEARKEFEEQRREAKKAATEARVLLDVEDSKESGGPSPSSKSSRGRSKSPAGQSKAPSGHPKSPSGRSKSPSGRSKSPSGRSKSPVARAKSKSSSSTTKTPTVEEANAARDIDGERLLAMEEDTLEDIGAVGRAPELPDLPTIPPFMARADELIQKSHACFSALIKPLMSLLTEEENAVVIVSVDHAIAATCTPTLAIQSLAPGVSLGLDLSPALAWHRLTTLGSRQASDAPAEPSRAKSSKVAKKGGNAGGTGPTAGSGAGTGAAPSVDGANGLALLLLPKGEEVGGQSKAFKAALGAPNSWRVIVDNEGCIADTGKVDERRRVAVCRRPV
jgi:hypothetical protein